jgi:hypothetical protein
MLSLEQQNEPVFEAFLGIAVRHSYPLGAQLVTAV